MTHKPERAQARILDAIKIAPGVDLRKLPIEQARQSFIDQQTPWVWCPHQIAGVTDLQVPGAAGPMRARLYQPPGREGPHPVVLYLHGGGWTFGNIDTHAGIMHWLAAFSGCAVLGIDYRLAPEHPFPAPLQDVIAAIAFIREGGLGETCNGSRLALAGDSAGANLALGALIDARDNNRQMADTACLFYGCYGPVFDTPSHLANGRDYLLTTEMMHWFWDNYLGPIAAKAAPATCAPLYADLSSLPALYLNAAGLDPLADDTTILANRLTEAGVRYRFDSWPGVVHGFLRFAREMPTARQALIEAGLYLDRFFADTPARDRC